MSGLSLKLFNFVIRQRWKIILAVIALTLVSSLQIRHLYFMQSQDLWLPRGDNTLAEFDLIRERFGPNQYLQISLSKPESTHPVFNRDTLSAVRELTEFLDGHELVVKVSSLSNHQYMESDGSSLWLKDFIEERDLKSDNEALSRRLEKRWHADPLLSPSLLSHDAQYTRISALVTYREKDIMHHVELVQAVEKFVKDKGYQENGIQIYYSGFSLIAAYSALDNMKDQSILLPVSLLLLLLLLRIVLGRWVYAWQSLTLASCTTLITLGAMAAMDFPLNMLNASLPLIIIAISVVDSVHLISCHNKLLREGQDSREAAINTAQKLWRPCWFTTLTTALGFLTLVASDMVPVYQYGLSAAFSVVVAYLLTMTLIVCWLSFVRMPSSSMMLERKLPQILANISVLGDKYRDRLLWVTMVLMGTGIWGATQLNADANYINFFRTDSTVSQGIRHFDTHFGGANNLEISLDSGRQGGTLEPDFLLKVAAVEKQLDRVAGIGEAQSLNDYLRNIHSVFTGEYELPQTRQQIAQYLFLYSANDPVEDLTELRSADNRFLRLSLPIKNQDGTKMAMLLAEVSSILKKYFSDSEVIMSGDLMLQHKTEVYIHQNLVQSFSLALAAILLTLLVQFRSLYLGLLAMVPSLLPLLVASVLMSLFNINLDFGTMIVAAITMGIAVDDTIHVINDYQVARKQGRMPNEAVKSSLSGAGLAILSTSIILFFAFVVMAFSHFMPNVYFGVFSAVIIVSAVIADLILTPALLVSSDRESAPIKRSKVLQE